MSDTIQSEPTVDSATVAYSRTVRQSLKRRVGWIVIALLILAIVALGALVNAGASPDGVVLGADNPAPQGSRAVAEVLREHGVRVVEASTASQAQAMAGIDSTMLIFDPSSYLSASQLRELGSTGSTMVLVQPDFTMLRVLAPTVSSVGASSEDATVAASCDLPAALKAATIRGAGELYSIESPATTTGCFPTAAGRFLLTSTRSAPGATVTVLGTTAVLTNSTIGNQGNAALALNLLGERSTLVWYLPTAADVTANGRPDLSELTPGWVTPVVLLAFAVLIAAAIWRGRRFGPLVVENLPVVVRSGETTEGRARLYQRSNARVRTLDALRIGTIGRIARLLGLPASAPVDDVIDTAADLLARGRGALAGVLRDRLPETDSQLIALSDQLRDLEADVAHAVQPAHPAEPEE